MHEFVRIRCRYCRYLDWLDISDPKERTKAPRKTILRIQPQTSQVHFVPLGRLTHFYFGIWDSCWLCIDQGLFNQLASLTTSWSRNMDGIIAWSISKVWQKVTFHSYVWMQCPSVHWWSLSELDWHTEGYRQICPFFCCVGHWMEGLEWIGMADAPTMAL